MSNISQAVALNNVFRNKDYFNDTNVLESGPERLRDTSLTLSVGCRYCILLTICLNISVRTRFWDAKHNIIVIVLDAKQFAVLRCKRYTKQS